MSAIQLVIPTHRRVSRQTTLLNLSPALRKRTLLVVSEASERDELLDMYRGSVAGVLLARGTSCIAEKRHWIMKNVDADVVFMMDDDLTFYTRCLPRYRQTVEGSLVAVHPHKLLKESTPAQLESMFLKTLHEHAVDLSYGAIGISSRMGNNRVVHSKLENTRLMHAFGVRSLYYHKHKLNFGEVKCREDFNVALRLLRLGYKNVLWCDTCVNPGSYNAAGGASTERSMEQSNAEAERLAALHPGLVRLVHRDYTSSVPRTEVVIQWKKAYGAGK